MKYLIFLLIVPNALSYLYNLKNATECDDPAKDDIKNKGFTVFFEIPLKSDQDEEFKKYSISYDDSDGSFVSLEWPTNEKIEGKEIKFNVKPTVCYNSSKLHPNLYGKIYFVEKDYSDMDVYLYKNASYIAEVSKNYTTIFSKEETGSTLSNFKIDTDTAFEIHSLIVGDKDSTLLFTYNSSFKLDKLFIPEPYFYIQKTGKGAFNFSVTDGAGLFFRIIYLKEYLLISEDPFEYNFDSSGFILTPKFPELPGNNYLDASVGITESGQDRQILIKVTAAVPKEASQSEFAILAEEPQSLTVTVGSVECIKLNSTSLTGECSARFAKDLDSFSVKSEGLAYILQFELEDIPSTTVSPTTTEPKGSTSTPRGTCPPVTKCPVVCPVCPSITTVTPCVYSTSTTEVPTTTTMGASTSTVSSLITLLSFYYIL